MSQRKSMKSFSLICLALLAGSGARAAAQNAPIKTATMIEAPLISPLNLEESIRLALRLNDQPEASELQAQSAQKRITAARSALYPQATASVGYEYLNRRLSGVPANGGFGFGSSSTTTTDLAVTQNLFDGGRTRQQVRSAQAQSRGALGSFGSARSGLTSNCASKN